MFLIRLMKEHNKENFCDPGESRKCLEHGTVVGFTIEYNINNDAAVLSGGDTMLGKSMMIDNLVEK